MLQPKSSRDISCRLAKIGWRRDFPAGVLNELQSGRVALGTQVGDDAPVLHLAGTFRAVADLAICAVTLGPHDIISRVAPILGVEPDFGQNLLASY